MLRYVTLYYTYLLTPWSRVLFEKLASLQLVKKFPAFYGTRRFLTALTSARHLSLSWASPIQSSYPNPISWRSILILSSHLRLGLPSGLFPSGFPTSTLYTPLPSPIRATCPAHLIYRAFKMAKLLIGDISYLSKVPERARRNGWPTVINPSNAELNPICHLLALLGAQHNLHVSRIRVKISQWYRHLLKWEEPTSMKVRNTDVDSGISFYFLLYEPLHIFQRLSHHQLQVNSQLDCEEVPVTGWIVVDVWIDKHNACARSCQYGQQTGATFNKRSCVRQASYISSRHAKYRRAVYYSSSCPHVILMNNKLLSFRTSCFVKRWEKGVQWCTKSAIQSADKSLARPGRKQANVSVRIAWISFGALPCRKKKKLDSSCHDVVEIMRIPDMLPSSFPSWSG